MNEIKCDEIVQISPTPLCKTCFSTSEWIWHTKKYLVNLQKFWDLGGPPPPCWEKFPNNIVFFSLRTYLIDHRAGCFKVSHYIFILHSKSSTECCRLATVTRSVGARTGRDTANIVSSCNKRSRRRERQKNSERILMLWKFDIAALGNKSPFLVALSLSL